MALKIPFLNKKNKIKKIYKFLNVLQKNSIKKNSAIKEIKAVVMAGGLGTRMAPVTDILPKPLIPINGKPVLNYIIDSLEVAGIKNILFTLNYKNHLIKAYMKENKFISKINYFEEKKPLGTVGCIKNIKNKLTSNFLLTNCDTIINADLNNIYKYHKKNKFDITIVSCLKKVDIPYGVCELDDEQIFIKINEKPNYNFLINTGLYFLNKEVIDLIPSEKFDMNQLIELAKTKNKKIGIFPISEESWTDVGNWKEYNKVKKSINIK